MFLIQEAVCRFQKLPWKPNVHSKLFHVDEFQNCFKIYSMVYLYFGESLFCHFHHVSIAYSRNMWINIEILSKLQAMEAHSLQHFLDNCLTDGAVRLSVLCIGCPLTSGRFLVLISDRDWVDPGVIVKLEGFQSPFTSLGIKPATFWLVA
jgi:hypothetical protein